MPTYARLFPTAQFKGIDVVKLCTLQMIILDSTFENALMDYDKPALISPNDEEEGLYALPSAFTTALCQLTDDRLADAAEQWGNTDELRGQWSACDAAEVIAALSALAHQATRSSLALYHYWSL